MQEAFTYSPLQFYSSTCKYKLCELTDTDYRF